MIGVVGAGRVGAIVVRQLVALDADHIVVYDANPVVVRRVAESAAARRGRVVVGDQERIRACQTVVVAGPVPHARAVHKLSAAGCHVISVSDDLDDVRTLLNVPAQTCLVVGAAASPGFTGLVARHLAGRFDTVDEIHVASHGTGGPACAQQHHRALGGTALGWHDGAWIKRPAGSGRELCWFPDPVGGLDCYRSESPEPVVLARAFPEAQRISARVSATRRDRLTSRLPMLAPPHPEGMDGAVRIEVRGWRGTERHVEIIGAAERLARMTGLVAAATTHAVHSGRVPCGVHVLGDTALPNDDILRDVTSYGVRMQEFIGTSAL